MAITTRIARSYSLRMHIIAIACVVFGLWGIWDYAYTIPVKEIEYREYEVLEAVKDSLETETDDPELKAKRDQARNLLTDHLDEIIRRATPDSASEIRSVADPRQRGWVSVLFALASAGAELSEQGAARPEAQEAQALVDAIRQRSEAANRIFSPGTAREYDWFKQLLLFHMGLEQPATQPPVHFAAEAYAVAEEALGKMGGRKKPGELDRIMKGLVFIPCLPFAFYMWWLYFRAKAKVYKLDDDGTLHMPEGTWSKDDIADIDMSRWMAKSIAHVVHTDGTRVKLDDYLYKDLHLIIGSIASGFYPEEWTDEGKPVEQEEDETEEDRRLAEEALAAGDDEAQVSDDQDYEPGDEAEEEEPEEDDDKA